MWRPSLVLSSLHCSTAVHHHHHVTSLVLSSLHCSAADNSLSLSLSISNIDLPQPSCLPLVHHHHQQRPKPKISYSADENVKINLFLLNFYSFPFSKIGKKRNLYIRWNHLGFGVKPLSFHWSICYDVDWLIRCHPISHWLNCKMS